MTTKDLQIGQVIYIVSDKSGNVIPAIVAEEVVIRTLEGNSTSWKLFVGPAANRQVIDSRKVTGDVYSSLEEVYNLLNTRLTDFLNGTLQEAKQRASKWYGVYIDDIEKNGTAIASITDASGKIDADQLLESVNKSSQEDEMPSKQQNMPINKKAISKKQKTPQERLKEAFGPDEEAYSMSPNDAAVQNGDIILKKVKVDGELVDMPFRQMRDQSGNIELVPV